MSMVTIPLTPVDSVQIMILMDNVTDPLLFPTEHVGRTTWFYHFGRPRVASAITDNRANRRAGTRARHRLTCPLTVGADRSAPTVSMAHLPPPPLHQALST
jgi:hypothetical protein